MYIFFYILCIIYNLNKNNQAVQVKYISINVITSYACLP